MTDQWYCVYISNTYINQSGVVLVENFAELIKSLLCLQSALRTSITVVEALLNDITGRRVKGSFSFGVFQAIGAPSFKFLSSSVSFSWLALKYWVLGLHHNSLLFVDFLVLELDDSVAPFFSWTVLKTGRRFLNCSNNLREQSVIFFQVFLEMGLKVVSNTFHNSLTFPLAHSQVFVLTKKLAKEVIELLEEWICQFLEFLRSTDRTFFLLLAVLLYFFGFNSTTLSDGYSADHVANGQIVEVFLLLQGVFGSHDDWMRGGVMDLVARLQGEFAIFWLGRPPGCIQVANRGVSSLCGLWDDKSVPLHWRYY